MSDTNNPDAARHKANLDELRAVRKRTMDQWEAEDAAADNLRRQEREERMKSFDRGLEAFNAATDGDATWESDGKAFARSDKAGDRADAGPANPSMPIAAPRPVPTPANVAASNTRDGFPPITQPSQPVAEPPTPAAVAVVTPPKS